MKYLDKVEGIPINIEESQRNIENFNIENIFKVHTIYSAFHSFDYAKRFIRIFHFILLITYFQVPLTFLMKVDKQSDLKLDD